MKQTILALSATVAALALAPSAQAAVFVVTLSGSPLTAPIGNTVSGSFSDTFNFNLPSIGTGTSALQSIGLNIGLGTPGDVNFTSIVLDGVHFFSIINTFIDLDPGLPVAPLPYSAAVLGPTSLAAGPHSLVVTGTSVASGSYSGNLNVSPAVPEPTTWAMMIAGFGLAGVALRRRSTAARNVAVSFV